MRKRNAKNLGIALVTLADPTTGAMLKVIDETQKFLRPPRRRRRKRG